MAFVFAQGAGLIPRGSTYLPAMTFYEQGAVKYPQVRDPDLPAMEYSAMKCYYVTNTYHVLVIQAPCSACVPQSMNFRF